MGTNKKNPRAKEPQTVRDKIFSEYDISAKSNIDQHVQTQGTKSPRVIPASAPFSFGSSKSTEKKKH